MAQLGTSTLRSVLSDSVFRPPLPHHRRQTAAMGVTVVVFAETEGELLEWHQRVCDLLGLEPLGRPTLAMGRDRWMARAQVPVPRSQATAHE